MFSQSLLRQQLRVAANQRETRKMYTYEQHKLSGGSVAKVMPLVMEHFGSWEKKREIFAETGSLFIR